MTLYPDVRCKVLYQRDYLHLLVKYGLEQPEQGSLVGQPEVTAPSGEDVPPLLKLSG
jgi:hypothetical protein